MANSASGVRAPSSVMASYIEDTATRDDPSPTLTRVLDAADRRHEIGQIKQFGALDIGAGGGRDTRHLLADGWRVLAQDVEQSCAVALDAASRAHPASLQIHIGPSTGIEGRFGLINCNNVLPFMDAETRAAVLRDCRSKLVPGGFLLCNFWGAEHGWRGKPGRSCHEEHAVQRELRDAGFADFTLTSRVAMRRVQGGETIRWHDIYVEARVPATPEGTPCCTLL